MLSDPRIGLIASLLLAGAGALWLLAQWLASDALWYALWPVLGYGTHAVTFLSIFLVLAGSAVALLFGRYARVKADLMAGRHVIAHWRVDPAQFQNFKVTASARDRTEKRRALYLIIFFLIVVFGLIALFDPEVAPPMMIAAATFALVITTAFLAGGYVRGRHLQLRSGEIIVGRDGLLINDVLHVWNIPMSRLVDVELDHKRPATLTITYAFLARYGLQFVDVLLPVPDNAIRLAQEVRQQLKPEKDKDPHRNRSAYRSKRGNANIIGRTKLR